MKIQKKTIHTYDPDSLEYKYVRQRSKIIFYVALLLIALGGIILNSVYMSSDSNPPIEYEQVPVIIKQNLEFSEQALWDLLVGMHVRFPHIVVAQARVESAIYTSPIFLENNNIFGMKVSRFRCTTHRGESRGHARYDSWQESAIDYAFYQTSYLRKCKTEMHYFELLATSYAESGHSYATTVKAEAYKVLKMYGDEDAIREANLPTWYTAWAIDTTAQDTVE